MRNIITFGGTQLSTFGMYNNGRGTYNAPARDLTMLNISGRSGDIVIDNKRFENIELTYPDCWIYDNFETNVQNLRAYLLSKTGYQRLEDTYHPDEFRMAVCKNAFEIDVDILNKFGMFDLVFDCKPQRFLKSGETRSSAFQPGGSSITNPTLFDAKPLIQVHGYGTFQIGDHLTTIDQGYGANDIYIDCDMMDAYIISGNTVQSKNDKVTFSTYNFPVLKPGINNIYIGSQTISYMYITPRWWTI